MAVFRVKDQSLPKSTVIFLLFTIHTPLFASATTQTPIQIRQWDTSCIQKVSGTSEDAFLIQDFIQKVRAEVSRFDETPKAKGSGIGMPEINSRDRLSSLLSGISGTYLVNGHNCIQSILSQLVGLTRALPDVEAVGHPLTQALMQTLKTSYHIEPILHLYRLGWTILGRARAKKDPSLTDDAEQIVMEAIRGLARQNYQGKYDAASAAPIFLEFLSAGVSQRGRYFPESAYTVVALPALEKLIFFLPRFGYPETSALGKALLDQTVANISKAIQQAQAEGPSFLGNGYNTRILDKGINVLANIHCYVGATNETQTLIEGAEKALANRRPIHPGIAVAKARFTACSAGTTGHYFSFVTENPFEQ